MAKSFIKKEPPKDERFLEQVVKWLEKLGFEGLFRLAIAALIFGVVIYAGLQIVGLWLP